MGALLILAVVASVGLAAMLLSSAIRDFAPLSSLAAQFNIGAGHGEVVADRESDLQPLGTSGPLRFSTPTAVPIAEQPGAATDQASDPFAGTEASVSDPNPAVGADVTARLKLVRGGQPLSGVPVYAIAHFRTIPNDRWPPGSKTVETDDQGVAEITQNIGNVTRGFEVKVDLVANVDGEEKTWSTSFTPQ